MPYVTRKDGKITVVARFSGFEGQEYLPDDHPEILARELAEKQAAHLREIKAAGFARVHSAFPPHKQIRLAFKANTDAGRKSCAALIEAVKSEVDKAEAAMQNAIDQAGIDQAAAKFKTALAAI